VLLVLLLLLLVLLVPSSKAREVPLSTSKLSITEFVYRVRPRFGSYLLFASANSKYIMSVK
jgi:hypothetical protein